MGNLYLNSNFPMSNDGDVLLGSAPGAESQALGASRSSNTLGAGKEAAIGASSGSRVLVPRPNFPPSGAPAPYNFPDADTTYDRKGALDYLSNLMDYIHNHPSDPVGFQNLLQFILDISERDQGKIPSDIMSVLDAGESDGAGAMNAISIAVTQAAEYAFFVGYGGGIGSQGMLRYLIDLSSIPLPGSNKYLEQMLATWKDQLDGLNDFTAAHTAGADDPNTGIKKGDRIWTIGSITYDWTNPNIHMNPTNTDTTYNDRYYIAQIMNNTGQDGRPIPFTDAMGRNIAQLQRTYRITALEELLKEFKDPIVAITLWIMGAYDDHLQSEQSGLNETTDVLTMMTNSIATKLSTLAQSIGTFKDDSGKIVGKMTPDQVKDFVNTLLNGTTLMNLQPQLAGISSEWNQNVYQAIMNIQVNVGVKDTPTPLGNILLDSSISWQSKADALNSLNPDPRTSSSDSPNQGYQELISVLQQAGSYVTGTSKTVSMQLQTDTSISAQLIKTWSTMLQSMAQWMIKVIANYKTQ